MKDSGAILIVDDNPSVLMAAKLLLKQHYQTVKTTTNPFDIDACLKGERIDVILLDMNFSQDAISGQEGFYWLQKILDHHPSSAVLLMTAFSDIPIAVEAIKAGATDFIGKPWNNDELIATVAAAMSHAKNKQQVNQLSRKTQGLSQVSNQLPSQFLGESQAMQRVFSILEKAAQTDANILITGESGTGKELTARAIHLSSPRAEQTFVGVDMGAISESLFESELFGHKKGAFTDAKTDRVGRFELAQGGSLFLDELGNLPMNLQSKLLAALQNRQISPVGANQLIDIDIRLICATNENLHLAVNEQRFRQDLLYRINTVEIPLPPLRERHGDIPVLIQYYLDLFCQKYRRELSINPSDLRALENYTWPGNVRELAHVIERAVILSDQSVLDLSAVLGVNNRSCTANHPVNEAISPESVNSSVSADNFDLSEVEKETIKAALKHYQGNVSHAAKALGLTRGAMYRRLEKYGL